MPSCVDSLDTVYWTRRVIQHQECCRHGGGGAGAMAWLAARPRPGARDRGTGCLQRTSSTAGFGVNLKWNDSGSWCGLWTALSLSVGAFELSTNGSINLPGLDCDASEYRSAAHESQAVQKARDTV